MSKFLKIVSQKLGMPFSSSTLSAHKSQLHATMVYHKVTAAITESLETADLFFR